MNATHFAELPLSGVRVLDFTQVFLGPSCTQLLGDFGAEVIKIERPGVGDLPRRSIPDPAGPDNPIFLAINRNKRSIAIDTRTDAGREVIYDLARTSDVVVSNFRAGVMERLGFGYDRLKELNPRAIWASGTGFGSAGPHKNRDGQDVIAQAYSGVMWRRVSDDDPLTVYPTALCDYTTGMHLMHGILLALRHRERTGEGQKVEVTMYDSMLHMQMQEACMQLTRGYEINWGTMPLTGVFETTDGALCVVGGFRDNALHYLSLALGLEEDLSTRAELATLDGQFEHRGELQRIMAERFATNTTNYWLKRLEQHNLLCAPVRSLAEALVDPQTQINQMLVDMDHPVAGRVRTVAAPIHLSASPSAVTRVPPRLGEHTGEVLRELGYPESRVAELRESGAVA